jgi:hypothetical protein
MITIEKLSSVQQFKFENSGVINPQFIRMGIQSIFYIGLWEEIYLPLAMQNGRTNYSSRKNGKASFFRGNLIMKTKGRRS